MRLATLPSRKLEAFGKIKHLELETRNPKLFIKMINPINLHQDMLFNTHLDSHLNQLRQAGEVNNFLDQLRQIQQEEGVSEPRKGEKAKLLDLCYKVESMLVYQMVKGMRHTIQRTDFLHAGMAEDIFRDMLDHHRAEDMSRTGNFGLAKQLYAQLSRYL